MRKIICYFFIFVILVELWTAEADLSGGDFLMYNEFCYSCQRTKPSNSYLFSHEKWKLQWPLLDAKVDSDVMTQPNGDSLNYLSKIGRENKYPRDPFMLSLCSWKQEQCEGIGLVTLITENIIKELNIKQSQVVIVKVGYCDIH